MSEEGTKCIKCGELPYLHKYYGDNGSSANGISWEIKCGCGHGTDIYKSYGFAESEWDRINQKQKDNQPEQKDEMECLGLTTCGGPDACKGCPADSSF